MLCFRIFIKWKAPKFLKTAWSWKFPESCSGCDLEKISGSWDCWKKSTTLLRHNFYAQYGSHKIQVLPISSFNVYDFHKNIDTKRLIWNTDTKLITFSYNWFESHFDAVKGRLVKADLSLVEKKGQNVSYIPWIFDLGPLIECFLRGINFLMTISYFNLHYRRLGDVLRRKRYSKRPGRGKASSFPSTSEVQVEVNRQQIGGPSSKTMLHESRTAFLAAQSARLNARSTLLSERPAKVQHLLYFLSISLTMFILHIDTFTNTVANMLALDLWLENTWNYNSHT